MKNFLTALWCWSLAVAGLSQQNAQDWYNKASRSDQPSLQLAYYSNAIKMQPTYAEAYRARAAVKEELGEYSDAIHDYSQAVRIDPQHADTYYHRGACRFVLQQYDAAIGDFDAALQLKPNHIYALAGKGCALLLQDKLQEALGWLDQALQQDANLPSANHCKIETLRRLNRHRNIAPVESQPIIVSKVLKSAKLPAAESAPTGDRYVLKEATSLREGSDHTTRVLLRFEAGDRVELLEKTDRWWWKVQYKGKIGYVKAALLTTAP